MAEPDDDLWNSLKNFRIGPANAALSFTARLAAENGWSTHYADRVVAEYKRFLYLAMRAGHAVTPSDQVDQAWHLHLAYTESYWDDLCGRVLNKRLDHGPTSGGAEQQARFIDQYDRTLASYRTHFNANPPADIWPPTERRFSTNFRRVDVSERWLLPRPSIPRDWAFPIFWLSLIFAIAFHYMTRSTRVQSITDDLPAHPVTIGLGIVALIVLLLPKTDRMRRNGGTSGSSGSDGGCSGGDGIFSGMFGGDGGGSDSGCGSGCGGGGCGGGGD